MLEGFRACSQSHSENFRSTSQAPWWVQEETESKYIWRQPPVCRAVRVLGRQDHAAHSGEAALSSLISIRRSWQTVFEALALSSMTSRLATLCQLSRMAAMTGFVVD